MHPILGHFRRLTMYLLAWIPLAGLLTYLMAVTAGVPWRAAIAMAFPLCFLYAFVCLSAWYPCRNRQAPRWRSSLPQGHLWSIRFRTANIF